MTIPMSSDLFSGTVRWPVFLIGNKVLISETFYSLSVTLQFMLKLIIVWHIY